MSRKSKNQSDTSIFGFPNRGVKIRSGSIRARNVLALRLKVSENHVTQFYFENKVLKPGHFRGRAKWCAVCSSTGKVDGKLKRSGFKSRYQYSICKLFACQVPREKNEGRMFKKTCWERWHETERLRLN